jgi:hypothetical protein
MAEGHSWPFPAQPVFGPAFMPGGEVTDVTSSIQARLRAFSNGFSHLFRLRQSDENSLPEVLRLDRGTGLDGEAPIAERLGKR